MTNYLKNKKVISMYFFFLISKAGLFFIDKSDQAKIRRDGNIKYIKYIFVSKHVVFELTNSVFCFNRRGSA